MLQNLDRVCLCEYDGSNYSGWQFQKNALSIQEVIEKSLSVLYNDFIRIVGSGRTDAGVHATGQIFAFKATQYRPCQAITHSLNNTLPSNISILETIPAPENFHPIKDAISKTYTYKILNRESRSAILYNKIWHRREKIDTKLLLDTLKLLEGTHDFSSFCMAKSSKDNNIRTINNINLIKNDDIINITFNGNGFLHNMIRIIIGTALTINNKKLPATTILNILNAKNRTQAFQTAPACGLYLKSVEYNNMAFSRITE